MSDYREERRSGKSTSDNARAGRPGNTGSRPGQERGPTRPGARGAGKSYSELRYQAGRGDGRGSRNRDRDRTDRGPDRTEPTHPGSKGDGDKVKDVATKGSEPAPATLKEIPTTQAVSAADLEAQWQQEEEEKRREEERKREEEEKAKREEERMRQKEEEEKRKEEEEKKSVEDFIREVNEKNTEKLLLREKNLSAADNRPEDSFFSKLDSSLKKNTAFVRKLKLLSESQKDSLTKDFNGLNLTKYIGEVAAAITEAKLKMSDIGCAIHMSSILHQRYSDFAMNLMENWQKHLLTKRDEKIPNPSKYRVDLRFFAELVAVGVFKEKEGLPLLANQLGYLINNDKEEHNNLSILTSFCKHCGDDYAGLVPRKYRKLAERFQLEVPKSKVLTPERQRGCRNLLGDYFTSLSKHLCADHKDLKLMEKQNRKTILTKGELSAEKKEKYEEAYNSYQKLLSNTATFADLLDEDMPDLPEEEIKQDDEGGLDIFNPMKNIEFQYEGDSSLFEDEETRTFYESLPDLKASIPGILYKESEGHTNKDEQKDDTGLEEDMSNLEIEDVEREMETEKELAEAESKEDDKKEDQKEEMELPPIVEGRYSIGVDTEKESAEAESKEDGKKED